MGSGSGGWQGKGQGGGGGTVADFAPLMDGFFTNNYDDILIFW